MSNFTPSREVASNFADMLIEVDIEETDVLTAPDYLSQSVVYYHESDEWRPVTEGEIRLDGEILQTLERDQITVGEGGSNRALLPDKIEEIPLDIVEYDEDRLFSDQEHSAVREIVLSFVDYDYDPELDELDIEGADPPEGQEALLRIENWAYIYQIEFSSSVEPESPRNDHILQIVEYILAEA